MAPANGAEEICIRYMDVNRAQQQAKYELRYMQPRGLRSLEPQIAEIAMTGELMHRVSKILAHK